MTTLLDLLYEEDVDRAYFEEMESEEAELRQRLEDAETIHEHLDKDKTPLLKAEFAQRVQRYQAKLSQSKQLDLAA